MTADYNLDSFLEMLAVERNAAANTRAAYRRDLKDLAKYLGPRDATPSSANAEDLRAYLANLSRRESSARTAARRLSAFRQFYKFLIAEGHRRDDPTAAIDAPRLGRPLPKLLSEEEMSRLIAVCSALEGAEGARLTVMLELLYAAGLRVSELVKLPLAAVLRDQPVLIVRGKGSKDRMVPLNAPARAAINVYLGHRAQFLPKDGKASAFLFPSRGVEGHLTRQRFGQMLKELAAAAQIPADRISPHVVRHAFATHLLDHGADLRSLQKMLGHADIATTQIYTHVAGDRLRSLVAQHHPLAKAGKQKAARQAVSRQAVSGPKPAAASKSPKVKKGKYRPREA